MGEQGTGGRAEILVIEDNEDDFVLVREFLPADEFSLTWCDTARCASEVLQERSFDAILLDHGLPDSNALSLLEQIQQRVPGCPVIVLTGRDDRALALSTREKGARSYLLKEEIEEHLLPALRDAVGPQPEGPGPEPVSGAVPRFADTAEQYYKVLLETMNEGCVVVDREGVVTFVSPAVDAMVSCDARRLLGGRVLDLFTPASAEHVHAHLEELGARAGGRKKAFEAELAAALAVGASPTPVRVSAGGLHRADGTSEGALLVLTDISEQVRARQMREDLVNTTVHDLRNPLSAMVTALESTKWVAGALDDDTSEAIDLSLACARKMLGLVRNLLEIGRLEDGHVPLEVRPVALGTVIEDVIETQVSLARARGVRLTLEPDDVIAAADPAVLARVLQNLVDNALAFAPVGSDVVVRCGRGQPPGTAVPVDPAWCYLAVSDEGPGIDPVQAERVFERFVTSTRRGSGLGLAFCRLAIEAHGGRIWLESEPGRGTTFYCTVPAG
ncbi:MAG: response regulator [Myxococcales bacterium]|nr:response regulator [Myxococcales bacterium]